MSNYYDDNFGHYEINDQEDIDFYWQMQRESVWKRCERCQRMVHIHRKYGICNNCADERERGLEY